MDEIDLLADAGQATIHMRGLKNESLYAGVQSQRLSSKAVKSASPDSGLMLTTH
jgi:hypothetical protein